MTNYFRRKSSKWRYWDATTKYKLLESTRNHAATPSYGINKDALYFNDMLSWNLLAMKKAHFYAGQCQDPALKTVFEQCGQMHQRHYEQILKHLNTTQPFNNMQ